MDPNFAEQLWAIVRQSPLLQVALDGLAQLNLPAGYLGAGCLAQTVWNAAHGYTLTAHIKDIDLVYFDAGDLSYEGEDQVIQRAAPLFAAMPVQVDIKNQARVHLWYPDRFGGICPPYESSTHSLGFFASKTHAIGVRLDGRGLLEVVAPFGLEPMFAMRIEPNRKLQNSPAYEEKAARARVNWPEVVVLPW